MKTQDALNKKNRCLHITQTRDPSVPEVRTRRHPKKKKVIIRTRIHHRKEDDSVRT